MARETDNSAAAPHTANSKTLIDEKASLAEQKLRALLTAIRAGQIALCDWEKISIENSLSLMGGHLYTPALHEIACATCPSDARSPYLSISARTAARTLDDFERELERLMQRSDARPDHVERRRPHPTIEQRATEM